MMNLVRDREVDPEGEGGGT